MGDLCQIFSWTRLWRFRTSSRMIGTASRSRAAALATALTRQRPKIQSRTIQTTSGKKGIFGNDGKTFINSWPAKGWTEEFDKFHACDKNLLLGSDTATQLSSNSWAIGSLFQCSSESPLG